MRTSHRQLSLLAGVLIVVVLMIVLWSRSRTNTATPELIVSTTPETNLTSVPPPATFLPVAEGPPADRGPLPLEEIVGIGAVLRSDRRTDTVRIVNVLPDSPAFQAGLTSGLIIQKVDDIFITGSGLKECVGLLRGTIGSKVRLEVVDPNEELTNVVELTRQRVKVQM